MICCLGDQEFSSCALKLDPCTCGKLWLALRYCITAEGEFCLGFEGGCVWLRKYPSRVALLCIAHAVQTWPTCLAVCKVATSHQTPRHV